MKVHALLTFYFSIFFHLGSLGGCTLWNVIYLPANAGLCISVDLTRLYVHIREEATCLKQSALSSQMQFKSKRLVQETFAFSVDLVPETHESHSLG